jgi:hypothetical protein
VMNIVNRVVATPPPPFFSLTSASNAESPRTKIKACFILRESLLRTRSCSLKYVLDYLVSDEGSLCHAAFERGCLEHIASLIKYIAPAEPAPPEWEEDEPVSLAELREVCFSSASTYKLINYYSGCIHVSGIARSLLR